MKRPSLGAHLLGSFRSLRPVFGCSLGPRLSDGFRPSFNFFWLILWLLLTPVCMWGHIGWKLHASPGTYREEGGTIEPGVVALTVIALLWRWACGRFLRPISPQNGSGKWTVGGRGFGVCAGVVLHGR